MSMDSKWHAGTTVMKVAAEPSVAPDCGGMSFFLSSTSHQPPQQVNWCVRRQTGAHSVPRKVVNAEAVHNLFGRNGCHSPDRCLMLWLTGGPSHRINRTGFENIRKEMTEREVEAVLGVPAGDYATGPIRLITFGDAPKTTYFVFRPAEKKWVGNEAVIEVWFDDNGRVEDKRIWGAYIAREPIFNRLRRLLGL